jgi:hypothetical protein
VGCDSDAPDKNLGTSRAALVGVEDMTMEIDQQTTLAIADLVQPWNAFSY